MLIDDIGQANSIEKERNPFIKDYQGFLITQKKAYDLRPLVTNIEITVKNNFSCTDLQINKKVALNMQFFCFHLLYL